MTIQTFFWLIQQNWFNNFKFNKEHKHHLILCKNYTNDDQKYNSNDFFHKRIPLLGVQLIFFYSEDVFIFSLDQFIKIFYVFQYNKADNKTCLIGFESETKILQILPYSKEATISPFLIWSLLLERNLLQGEVIINMFYCYPSSIIYGKIIV